MTFRCNVLILTFPKIIFSRFVSLTFKTFKKVWRENIQQKDNDKTRTPKKISNSLFSNIINYVSVSI